MTVLRLISVQRGRSFQKIGEPCKRYARAIFDDDSKRPPVCVLRVFSRTKHCWAMHPVKVPGEQEFPSCLWATRGGGDSRSTLRGTLGMKLQACNITSQMVKKLWSVDKPSRGQQSKAFRKGASLRGQNAPPAYFGPLLPCAAVRRCRAIWSWKKIRYLDWNFCTRFFRRKLRTCIHFGKASKRAKVLSDSAGAADPAIQLGKVTSGRVFPVFTSCCLCLQGCRPEATVLAESESFHPTAFRVVSARVRWP